MVLENRYILVSLDPDQNRRLCSIMIHYARNNKTSTLNPFLDGSSAYLRCAYCRVLLRIIKCRHLKIIR